MHACGHDTHVAMLAGAASCSPAGAGELRGRVAFMFQPGEEGHHGARFMLEDGLLATAADGAEPVSMAFAIHQTPTIPSGMVASRGHALMASADELQITVRGRGGHASMPHHAGDPIPIACEIVTALQAMVTRRVDAFDPAVVTVAKIRAGSTTNVIPETATLWGTIRTVSEHTRTAVMADIERLATGIASAHGATRRGRAHPRLPGHGQPRRRRDLRPGDGRGSCSARERPSRCRRRSWAPRTGATCSRRSTAPWCSSAPGRLAWPPHDVAPNHSNRMVLDEDAMAAGIATYAGVALRWLAR